MEELEKDFNFLEINHSGLSLKNSLPPKYKYFVVQQFFNPKPWFGVENHFDTKTNVLVSNNFSRRPQMGLREKHPI